MAELLGDGAMGLVLGLTGTGETVSGGSELSEEEGEGVLVCDTGWALRDEEGEGVPVSDTGWALREEVGEGVPVCDTG